MAGTYRPGTLTLAATRWAPAIILCDLAIAILACWSGLIPAFLLCLLAVATGAAAIIVMLRYLRTIGLRTVEELGFGRDRHDLAGKGIRDEAYGLWLACFIGFIACGGHGPQAVLAGSAAFLTSAWASATRRWPIDDQPAP